MASLGNTMTQKMLSAHPSTIMSMTNRTQLVGPRRPTRAMLNRHTVAKTLDALMVAARSIDQTVDTNAKAIKIRIGRHDCVMRDMSREPKIVVRAISSVPALMVCRIGELVNLKLIWSNASWNVKAGNRKSSPIMKQIHINGLIGGVGASYVSRVSPLNNLDGGAFVADIRAAYRG